MSDTPNTESVSLTKEEATALAKHLIARHLSLGIEDWLTWEDVPFLSEQAFLRLWDAIEHEANVLTDASRAHDRAANIDSAYLLQRAQIDGANP